MVERHEADLRREVARVGHEPRVGLDQRDVEDRPKRVGHLVACALDMRADRRRLCDHLVLEARVELHVACLVDLLRREERRLFFGSVRPDEARELRRDALFGDHQ